MADWFYMGPAGMQDFKDPQHWHQAMKAETEGIIKDLVALVLGKDPATVTSTEIRNLAPALSYVNPLENPPPVEAETVGVAPWGAFPRAVERKAPWAFPQDPDDILGIYRAVEHLGDEDHRTGEFRDFQGNVLTLPARDRQDEYLEWVVTRDATHKMTKAVFVAEGYDYYAELFHRDEKLVTAMFQEFTGVSQITPDDLRARHGIKRHPTIGRPYIVANPGEFNPRNSLNINPGIVHLSHRANSLGAEVNLAGVSGIARQSIQGLTLLPGNAELLLCCSQGGNPNRNSDPLIGEQAYAQVVAQRHYTLANPVGLYIAGVETQRLTFENGDAIPQDWWRVIRGNDLWDSTKSRVLRLELEVPQQEGIVLGDLFVDGNPLVYGGQLAQLLSVHLFITRWLRADNSIGPIIGCSATCCKKMGTPELILSDGTCNQGYELAFRDLVGGQNAPLALAITDQKAETDNVKGRLG